MKKRAFWAIIGAVSFVIILVFSGFGESEFEKADMVYHVTLANPDLYKEGGIFADSFTIQKGEYFFRFIPNGDSPDMLSIALTGSSFTFSEDFELEGTPHETGISVYYTWDYIGEKRLLVQEDQELEIQINPYGNIQGPVSLDIIKSKK